LSLTVSGADDTADYNLIGVAVGFVQFDAPAIGVDG